MTPAEIKLLLIEDNPGDALLIREYLSELRRPGYRVELAERLGDAIERTGRERFDVVLIDLGLPDSSGLDTLIRFHAAEPNVPVVVLTGLEDEQAGYAAAREGAQDYLSKDLVTPELLSRSIRYAIERSLSERALVESEARYRSLVEAGPDITYRLDERGRIEFVSQNVSELGYDPPGLAGKTLETIIHPEDIAHYHNRLAERRVGDRATRDLEVRILRKDGGREPEYVPVAISARGMWSVVDSEIDASPKRFLGTVGVIRDIAERKAAEALDHKHVENLTAMVGLTAHLSMAADVDDLCRLAVELGRERLSIDRLSIWLVDEPGRTARGTFGTDEEGATRDERKSRIKLIPGDTLGRVMLGLSDREVVAEDTLRDHNGNARGTGWRAVMPLLNRDGVVIGALSADSLLSASRLDAYDAQVLRLYSIALGYLIEGVRIDAALRESQAMFKTLAETTTAAMFITQGETMRYVNPAAEMVLGYPREQLLTMDFCQAVHPDQREQVRRRGLARQRGADELSRYEIKLLTRNGEVRWVDFAAGLIEMGGAPAVLGTAFDITARKQAENALRDYSDRLEALRELDESILAARSVREIAEQGLAKLGALAPCDRASVVVFKPQSDEGAVIACSGEAKDELGPGARVTAKDLCARGEAGFEPFVCHDLRERAEPNAKERVLLEKGIRSIICIPMAAGGRLVGSLNLGSREPRAYNWAYRSIASDVADVLALAIEQGRLHEEVRKRAEELEARVAERTAELEAFTYTVSHDLRVPLRAIRGFGEMLLEDHGAKLDDEVKRMLGVITEKADHMRSLIDGLLALSRVGRTDISPAPVDVGAVASDAFNEASAAFDTSRVDFRVGALPVALADRAMLRQVFANLIGNAVKFTRIKEQPVVEIGAREEEEETVFYVRDNGAGFDSRYADKLFGVFQRLHTTEEFEGSGAGLAIVKRIVERHGGRVWGESEKDEGATFYFTLPRPRAEA